MALNNQQPRGLRALAKIDWQRRLDRLVDLNGKALLSHEIIDNKVDHDKKVPVAQVIDHARSRGLTAVVEGTQLHIARMVKPDAKSKDSGQGKGGQKNQDSRPAKAKNQT